MSPLRSFLFWGFLAALTAMIWYFDPWTAPSTRVLAGLDGRIVKIRVSRGEKWVEYRRREGLWYLHSYTRKEGEAEDPYRLSEGPRESEPSFEGLVGEKERRVRRIKGLNALIGDILFLLREQDCVRTFEPGELEIEQAGFPEQGLRVAFFSSLAVEAQGTVVKFGKPSVFATGFYYFVPRFQRYGIVAPTVVKFVVKLIERRFETAGAAAGRETIKMHF